jgi:hypothetical protein
LNKKNLKSVEQNLAISERDTIEFKNLHPDLHGIVPRKGDFRKTLNKVKSGEETCLMCKNLFLIKQYCNKKFGTLGIYLL